MWQLARGYGDNLGAAAAPGRVVPAPGGKQVEQSTSATGTFTTAAGCTSASTSTALTCTATALTAGTTYYFRVATKNSSGTSAYSVISSGMTPG